MGWNVFSVSALTRVAHIVASELEHLVVLQHARAVLSRVFLDFLHRELDLAGLQMRDIDLGAALELGELLRQHARAKVLRDDRELLLPVAERRLYDQVPEVGDLVHQYPQRVVRRGVAGKHQAALPRVQVVSDSGHDVVCWERRELAFLQLHRIADLDLAVPEKGLVRAGYLGEIRPDAPVEDVGAEDLQRRWNRPHRERLVAHAADRVHHEGDARDVVEVRVGQENVIDQGQLRKRKVSDPGSGVEQDVVVEQHGRGSEVPPSDSPAAAQNPELHRRYFSSKTVTPFQSSGGGLRRLAATSSAYSL